MDLVIDTSAIIAVIANEPAKAALVEQTAGAVLLAPHSVHWEIGNAFSAMLKRGRITLAQAQKALSIYQDIPIRFLDVELEDALALSSQLGIYAYDAYLLAAAQSQRCALLALDGGLVHAAKQLGIPVVEVGS
ncbi:MAG: type II toxin-antitoxin system VapC family toxin [Chloroflexota bacterium]|nr:type II toxin-antitoxin system VapC family toxin [Chloroflexota bacterium]